MGAVALGIVCIFMSVCSRRRVSFAGTLSAGLILFAAWEFSGGGVHLMAAELWVGKPQAGAMRRDSLRSRDPDAVHQ